MQSDVIRAPNGRVITNKHIALQCVKIHSAYYSGSESGAKLKSPALLPVITPNLMEADVSSLNNRIMRLFETKLDPCFIETVKTELTRDYGHVPDNQWLKGLSLKTKTPWDLFYYYLSVRLLGVSLAHDCNTLPRFSFVIVDDDSGLDRRKINGLKGAISNYILPNDTILVMLCFTRLAVNSSLEVKAEGQTCKINIADIALLVTNVDINIALQLIKLYLNDVLFRANIVMTRTTQIFVSTILFMAVVTLSPKVGNFD
jgi:hypothetical protein